MQLYSVFKLQNFNTLTFYILKKKQKTKNFF